MWNLWEIRLAHWFPTQKNLPAVVVSQLVVEAKREVAAGLEMEGSGYGRRENIGRDQAVYLGANQWRLYRGVDQDHLGSRPMLQYLL